MPRSGDGSHRTFRCDCFLSEKPRTGKQHMTDNEDHGTRSEAPRPAATPYTFQQLLDLTPGFHLVRIPFEEISRILDVHAPFNIELIPAEGETETTLYFGLMEFVREAAISTEKSTNVKCVIWDLDNTLWDGVLVEDGIEKLQLKREVVEVIQRLDSLGILNSKSGFPEDEQRGHHQRYRVHNRSKNSHAVIAVCHSLMRRLPGDP